MDIFEEKKDYIKSTELNTLNNANEVMADNIGGLYREAYANFKSETDALQSSRDTSLWFTRDDSPLMRSVKENQAKLTNFYETQTLASNPKVFAEQKKNLDKIYEELITSCISYLDKHKSPNSKSGKKRKGMVSNLLKQCQLERSAFSRAASYIYETGTENLSWLNVLANTRGFDIKSSDFEVSYVSGNTTNVTVLKSGEKKIFFKQEEKLESPKEIMTKQWRNTREYAQNKKIVQKFLNLLDYLEHREYIMFETSLKNAKNLVDVGNPEYREIASQYFSDLKMACRAHKIDYTLSKHDQEIILELLKRDGAMLTEAITRAFNAREGKIAYGSILSNRNVASSRVAKLLGCSSLICESETVRLHKTENGMEITEKGNAMVGSKGSSLDEIFKKTNLVYYTPDVYRKMNSLQVFDVICGQIDRNSSNVLYTYTLKTENENTVAIITDIQAIDNDMSFGQITYEDTTQYESGIMCLRPVVASNGMKIINAIDEELASAIMDLSADSLRAQLIDILSPAELDAAVSRLNGVKNLLQTQGNDIVRKSDGFTRQAFLADKGQCAGDMENSYIMRNLSLATLRDN